MFVVRNAMVKKLPLGSSWQILFLRCLIQVFSTEHRSFHPLYIIDNNFSLLSSWATKYSTNPSHHYWYWQVFWDNISPLRVCVCSPWWSALVLASLARRTSRSGGTKKKLRLGKLRILRSITKPLSLQLLMDLSWWLTWLTRWRVVLSGGMGAFLLLAVFEAVSRSQESWLYCACTLHPVI